MNGDVDLIVQGTSLLKHVDSTSNSTFVPHVDHVILKSIQDLKETFGYFHQKGAGGERSMSNFQDFQYILKTAKSLPDAKVSNQKKNLLLFIHVLNLNQCNWNLFCIGYILLLIVSLIFIILFSLPYTSVSQTFHSWNTARVLKSKSNLIMPSRLKYFLPFLCHLQLETRNCTLLFL